MISLNDKDETLVKVTYPWLPARYVKCNVWGHKAEECGVMRKGALEAHGRIDVEKQVKGQELSIGTQVTILTKAHAKEDMNGEPSLIEIGKEGQPGSSSDDQNGTHVIEDDTEKEWTSVLKGGRNSPKKQIDNKDTKGKASTKMTNEQELSSPSRFNVLGNISEEEDGVEEGEIETGELAKPDNGQGEDDQNRTIQGEGIQWKKKKNRNRQAAANGTANRDHNPNRRDQNLASNNTGTDPPHGGTNDHDMFFCVEH